jgi:hypothetical protein
MAFTTDLWRECSSPISDLRVSRTVSSKRSKSVGAAADQAGRILALT